MLNWLIIITIILIFMAIKLAKFMGIAIIFALLMMLIVKNQMKEPKSKGSPKKTGKGKGEGKEEDRGTQKIKDFLG